MAPQNADDPATERAIKFGNLLADVPPGEEVVISGLSGRLPDSDDVYEFRDKLMDKIDLVSCDNRRWEPTHPEIPQRTGKINNVSKFDAGFFGTHYRQAHSMDPMCRMLLEHSIEAIFDAGIHPSELENTNTGVFIGACFSETEKTWFFDKISTSNFAITGTSRYVDSNRISYFLKLKGPSYILDTACSSSLYALENAYRAIRTGQCDSAIVGGVNLCLHPFVSLQFARLGVLSLDGACKSFDYEANGYARSEAVCVVYLQKAKDARRVYSQVIHAKTNCDGYKEQGITYPSGQTQQMLLEEFYRECRVDPSTLSFVEAHGTGTKVGDPEEVSALDQVFCTGRSKPLLIGSVKSNLGHTEPASGLCSVTKMLIGMETGYIPPNIHYRKPREGMTALEQGRVSVVTEKTKWQDNNGLVGINSFGFGGANCHVLLRWNPNEKINHGQPRDDIPRLVFVSGRVEESVEFILNDIKSRKLDAEFVSLLHHVFKYNIPGHQYRGFAVLTKKGEIKRSLKRYDERKPPFCFVFGGPRTQWLHVGKDLFTLPLFASTVQRVHNVLSPLRVNIMDAVYEPSKSQKTLLNALLVNAVLQIAIIDILKILDAPVDYVFGYSYGEFIAAYSSGALSLEQTVLSIYKLANHLEGIFINNGDLEQLDVVLSKHFPTVSSKFLKDLKKIIPQPATFPENYLSATAEQTASAEYFVERLLNPSHQKFSAEALPHEFTLVEVGPGSLTAPVDQKYINFEYSDSENGVVTLLSYLGRFYEEGGELSLDKLYPKVSQPVARGTPMLSPLIKWDHSKDWYVTYYKRKEEIKSGERIIGINIKENEWSFVSGHVIDGRNLFPATGYLNLVWETMGMMVGMMISDMQIVFENVRFLRATTVAKDKPTELIVMIQRGSGNFEVIESGIPIVTGTIHIPKEVLLCALPFGTEISTESYPLKEKDIYKELRLRGYNYSGEFRALKACNRNASSGLVQWTGNWITFVDNMLQLQILNVDTRLLYVPTSIKKLTIDAKKHIAYAKEFGEDPQIPVFTDNARSIRSGGIEIIGLNASCIARRRQLGVPVLEKYVFVPNVASFTAEDSVRINIQLALENSPLTKVKVVELIDEATREDSEPLASKIFDVLGDLPLIQPEITVLTKKQMEIPNVTVEDKKFVNESGCHVVVVSNVLRRTQILQQALNVIADKGFILSREPIDFDPSKHDTTDLEILTIHTVNNEHLVLTRKRITDITKPTTIEIKAEDNFNWLPQLQNAIKTDNRVVIYAQNEPNSGIIGLFNCIRREPGGDNARCFFIVDPEAPKFDTALDFYKVQLQKDLAVNIYKDGKWGTYRHLVLDGNALVEREHCYVNVTVRGDLSSLRWIEGPLNWQSVLDPNVLLVDVYYSALNFRDVMTASGRITADVVTMDRLQQDCVQGFEFAGIERQSGHRVMGMNICMSLATVATCDRHMLWRIPDEWSFEDAVTIPVVYGTVYYALFVRTQCKKGESILIHAGSGGVGQAAIRVCLHYGLEVYTTVGTKEKRELLKELFPQLTDRHIGNSRDTSFEQMVYKQTKGRGVDYVLNSLAEEKLQASVRCLAPGGKFLEIGKFDLSSDNTVSVDLFAKGASFHGIMVDQMLTSNPQVKVKVHQLLLEGIKKGAIKPLMKTVFKHNEVEQAYRYMAAGKHVGKVLIKVQDEEQVNSGHIKGIPRYFCSAEKSVVITGGLGGFGLELADWLILRGARKLVLTSRTGIKTGYQRYRIGIWKSYGVNIHVATDDITTKQGCHKLLADANKLGPVEAIFNLAVVLQDALLENQTPETYQTSFGPKAYAVTHLDELSRELCPELRDFVVFSSVSCGRGNTGQTNYGMANSIMERICEKRRSEGFPALAIQWGAIGEVGLVAEMQEQHTELEIGGTLQQRIYSCMNVMDVFLRQDAPIVSSMVVAEKKGGAGDADNVVDFVANILGIRDIRTISFQSTLPELGLDSMMAVEIKQTLEREFEVFLTAQEIRNLTFARLQEIKLEQEQKREQGSTNISSDADELPEGAQLLVRYMGTEELSKIPLIRLDSLVEDATQDAPKVFLIPGLEGMGTAMEPFAANLAAHALCLQLVYDSVPDSIEETAKSLLPSVENTISTSEPFTIVAYSFGCVIGLELTALLEKKGYKFKLVLIDGAPQMLTQLVHQQLSTESEAMFETTALCTVMSLYMPWETIVEYKEAVYNCNSFEERVEVVLASAPKNTPHSPRYQKQVAFGITKRLKALAQYSPKFAKLQTTVKLFRPSHSSIHDLNADYGLSELSSSPVDVTFFKGNHVTILQNEDVAVAVNDLLKTERPPIFEKEKVIDALKNVEHIQVKQI